MPGSKLTTVEFSVFQVKLDLKSAVELCNGGYDLHHHLLWSRAAPAEAAAAGVRR